MTVPDTRTPFDEAGEAFAMLSRRAWGTNLDRAERLVVATAAVGAGTAGERGPMLREAGDLAHQIVGSAGTFGFDEVSALARQVESRLAADPVEADQLAAAAVEVRAALLRQQPDPG